MIGPILRLAAPYLAAGALALALAHFMPFVGYGARLERLHDRAVAWEKSADAWRSSSRAWEGAFRLSEKRRTAENQTAIGAVNSLTLQCDARVKQARASAKVVREIVNAPVKLDAGGCPVRGVVGADRLRDALQPR